MHPLMRFAHSRLEYLKTQGVYRQLQSNRLANISDSRKDFYSNDYLSLHDHPHIKRGAMEAVKEWGTGSTGSRLVSGNYTLLQQCETSLSQLCGWESAVIFSSGYLANLAAVTVISLSGRTVFSGKKSHASLIDACRLAKTCVQIFDENDLSELALMLSEYVRSSDSDFPVIIVDAVCSVDGSIAPLEQLYELAYKYEAALIVDEAHAIGVMGSDLREGAGVVYSLGLAGAPGLIVTGTLSKALASQGGFILCDSLLRELIVNTARQFIFDTGLNPAAAGAACEAIALMIDEPQRIARLRWLNTIWENLLDDKNIPYTRMNAQQYAPMIHALPIADPYTAYQAQNMCRQAGMHVGCFRPPSVPEGKSALRITLHSEHTREDMEHLVTVLDRVYTTLRIR